MVCFGALQKDSQEIYSNGLEELQELGLQEWAFPRTPTRGRDGVTYLAPRQHEASFGEDHFKEEFFSLLNVPPFPPVTLISKGSEI